MIRLKSVWKSNLPWSTRAAISAIDSLTPSSPASQRCRTLLWIAPIICKSQYIYVPNLFKPPTEYRECPTSHVSEQMLLEQEHLLLGILTVNDTNEHIQSQGNGRSTAPPESLAEEA